MTRKTPVPEVLVASLADADKVLEELAQLERRTNAIRDELNEKIDQAKAEAAEKMVEIEARRKLLDGALSSFAILNKAELFKGRKSVDLDFGTLSFRLSTKVVLVGKGVNWEKVVERLKELGYDSGLRVKEEVDKEALATWDDETLESVGVKKKTADVFGYKLKQTEPGLTQAA